MNITINNSNFKVISPLFNIKPETRKEKNKLNNQTNSLILPNHNFYKSISFGKTLPHINSEAFLLPQNCPPDKYQVEAAISISKGHNTIVTAPTGTGKTAIAHFAIKKNFEEDKKTFYTTPLKALSNQKYNDLKKLFGKENVGIMTGDRKENTKAPIIVMTTEIYRNMVASDYFGQKNDMLDNLKTVVFDEFHYMGDPDRGTVWEESIMYSPNDIQILALSATVGNNKKIAAWINATKENQASLINVPPENRHVPLEFRMFNPNEKQSSNLKHQANLNMKFFLKEYYGNKLSDAQIRALDDLAALIIQKPSKKGRKIVVEILRDAYKNDTVPLSEIQGFLKSNFGINEEYSHSLLLKLTNKKSQKTEYKNGRVIGSINPSRKNPMHVIKLIDKLNEKNKLPAIAFVFSKKYSEELLQTALTKGKYLTTRKEQAEIEKILEKYKKEYGFYSNNLNVAALKKGYALHSAAILPLQKQLIEELFNKKLIKVTFATETLAAGINMPARTVIMTDYQKPSGSIIEPNARLSFLRPLSANEFHQMAGRAGRRGIDKIGYVYLLNDAPEKEAQFEKLINSDPTAINSSLTIDASMVSGYYSYLTSSQDIGKIFAKSFSVYETAKEDRALKLKLHIKDFMDYTNLLNEYNFIKKVEGGYTTTREGELINNLKGKPQIPIVKAILNNDFKNATPVDLAGIVGAIATNPDQTDKNMSPIYPNIKVSDTDLSLINNELKNILSKQLLFNPEEINELSLDDEILEAIKLKYGHILEKDIDEIQAKREHLNELIKKEETELNKNYNIKQLNILSELKNHAESLREEKLIIRRVERIKLLLKERINMYTKIKLSQNDNDRIKYDIYNKIRKDFITYNDKIENTNPRFAKTSLNSTAFLLINKWAKLNDISNNYNENWDKVCSLLKETGAIKFEGDLFNAIAQTIDFLNQLDGMLEKAIKSNLYKDKEADFADLSSKCKKAIKLLKTPPLYSNEEI